MALIEAIQKMSNLKLITLSIAVILVLFFIIILFALGML
jgi:hypothetical protein